MPNPHTVLITAEQIDARVRELAIEIRRDYGPSVELHLVAVLKGAFVFLADLVRNLTGPVTLDFLAVSSYARGTASSGEVRLLKDLDASLEGRDVLIVEDIVDSGLTMAYLQRLLRVRAPRTLRAVCLLSKPARRQGQTQVDYVGFEIDDRFVVGYGLDYGERYRNLREIVTLG